MISEPYDPPGPIVKRWTIPISDFCVSLKQAIKQDDQQQVDHLLNNFWFCDNYMLLKSDIQGEVQ